MNPRDGEPAAPRLAAAAAALPEVRLAYLFGSRAQGRTRPDSDFDVAVLVDDALATGVEARGRTLRRLAGALGRQVSSASLDIVLLNDATILLRHRVLRDGVLLYQRSPEERVRFVTRAIREYQDGAIRREEFTKARIRRLKDGPIDGGPGDLLEKARGVARLLAKAPSLP